ncbi:MAG: SMC family ATPase [Candidatus Syntrophoarchaeum sp.]|nr:SMC family ATPase [Candidatus Syntrophoarchaeum sp.]
MLLKTLTLRNYRKYKNAYVELPDGVIGIIGLNGVGKTTLIEAIGWVLFGHHAARTTKELIKREGAPSNEPCSVALEFELEGDGYKVVREMVGKNLVPKASLVINGKQITNNAEEVTGVIEDRIGMDYQSFFTSVFARQKELNALSTMKAAERKKLVLRMLGIERIEKSIQAMREDKRGKEKKIEGIKAATVDKEGRKKIEVFKSKKNELTKTKEVFLPVIKEMEAAKVVKEKEAEEAKHELETATRKYEKYMELSNTMGERRSDLENTRKRKEEKEKELADLLVKEKRLEEIADKETQYFRFREKKDAMDAMRENYQRKQELLKREERNKQEMKRRAGEIKGLEEKMAGFEGVEAASESQMQTKEEMEVMKEKYQQKEELMRRKERTMQEIGGREEKTMRLREERKEFEDVEESVEAVKRRIEAIRKQRESIHSSLGAFKSLVLQNKKDIEESKEKKNKIGDLGPDGECPMCERELGTHYETLIKKLSEEIRTRKEKLYSVFNEYKSKKEELVAKENEEDLLIKEDKALEKRVTMKRELDVKIEHEKKELEGWKQELEVVMSDLKPFEAVKFDENVYKEVISKLSEFEKKIRVKKDLELKIVHEERELGRWRTELALIKTDLTPIMDVQFDENDYKDVISALTGLEVLYREIIGLKAEIERTGAVTNNVRRLSELERKITEDITALQRQIEELAFDKMAYVGMKARYDRKREELNETKLRLLEKKNEFENVCKDVERVLEEIEEQKRLIAEKEKEETAIMYLSLLEKIMNDFKVYMVGMIRPMLSDYASGMLGRLTDGKYGKLELDENYDVFVYDDGTAYEINRFSGGEEDLANLCLRLAISAVVTERSAIQTNFIILDEIFGSQDALRKRNIITALNELSKKFRQIFLITHIEEVKDYMEYVLRVTEDEEGASWVRMGA